jgi:glycosyltransferase involved in cell wall biosynthesis
MGAIARESAIAAGIRLDLNFLPDSRRELLNLRYSYSCLFPKFNEINLFLHHSTFLAFQKRWGSKKGRSNIFLTHFDPQVFLTQEDWSLLALANKFIVQNSSMKDTLQSYGINPMKIIVGYGAINRDVFHPGRSWATPKRHSVLIVGDCKPRKRPDLVQKVVDLMPEIDFIIHGLNWEEYSDLGVKPRSNVSLIPFVPINQPELVRSVSLLVSLSDTEGGPFPVLEALASGTPVVATDTGFCREVINLGAGRIISTDSSLPEIQKAIQEGLTLKIDTAERDLLDGKFTWLELAQHLYT